MGYAEMLSFADRAGLTVKELDLRANDGLIQGRNVAIRRSLRTSREKSCVLAEEVAHHLVNVGDLTNYNDANSWKQEQKGRTLAYHILIQPQDIISAYEAGCRNRYELAEHLDVTEEFLTDAIERFRQIYGAYFQYGRYIIVFEPSFGVIKL